jgi:ferredoxin--NADP+ reductase
MALPGAGTATETVAWINGHPDFAQLPVDLGHPRVVVIGNGNVALDVARILTTDPDDLARTDIASAALTALRDSSVREVIVARRGPAASAFTLPELIGLTATATVVLDAADRERVRRPRSRRRRRYAGQAGDPGQAPRLRRTFPASANSAGLLADTAPRPRCRPGARHRVPAYRNRRTGAPGHRDGAHLHRLPQAGPGLPFDDDANVVPNTGRVIDPGTGRPVPVCT